LSRRRNPPFAYAKKAGYAFGQNPPYGLRSLVSDSNVIFYRVRDDIAEIVRILDGRRDIDSIFLD
jgi:plasmid stabilization system protein ParE